MILGGLVMLAAWRSGTGIALNLFLVASAAYLFISAASLAIYAYTPELYPTRMRALGTSTATAWLRIASIIGPNIVAANLASAGLPRVFLIFSLVALAGGIIVSIFSKETRERVLEDVSP
jgi:putative MFS transporter